MIRWPLPLQLGDSVSLIALASHQKAHQEYYLKQAKKILEGWGLTVFLPDQVMSRHFYFAGTDKQRFEQLEEAWNNPQIKAIFTTRGGYGTARILHNFTTLPKMEVPKWIVGYSDYTTLLTFVQQEHHQQVVHGPCLATDTFLHVEESIQNQQLLRQLLFAKKPHLSFPIEWIKEGNLQGVVTGGCLSILVTTLATPYEIETENKILFLEDVGEPPYKIDRMLTHLKNAGKFNKIRGLVFGDMVGCEGDNQVLWKIIEDLFQDFDFPIVRGVPAGHGLLNAPLILGANYQVDAKKKLFRLSVN